MMLGEKVSAAEAERMGMIYKFFPDANFADTAMNIAAYLSKMPTKGLAYTKQVLSMSFTTTLEEQLQDEDVFQQKASQTSDYREAVDHFFTYRHFYPAKSFLYLQHFNAQPLAEEIMLHHVLYNFSWLVFFIQHVSQLKLFPCKNWLPFFKKCLYAFSIIRSL